MVNFYYTTVTEAVNKLMKDGYTVDFNLPENVKKFETGEYRGSDFKITGIYRYEGESDPGDEAIVYAIESKNGIRGLLVSGFGMAANKSAGIVLSKLRHYSP